PRRQRRNLRVPDLSMLCRTDSPVCPPPLRNRRECLSHIAIVVAILAAFSAHAADRQRSIRRSAAATCTEGSAAFSALAANEVEAIVHAAATALNRDTATIAVVDRAGRVLALF